MLKVLLLVALAIGAVSVSTLHAQELVNNGAFETGDFSGWTVVPGSCAQVASSAAQSGNFGATSGPTVGGCGFGHITFSQWLSPIPNQLYELSFNYTQVDNPDNINCPYLYWVQCAPIALSHGQSHGLGYFRIGGFSGPPIESEFDWGTSTDYQTTWRMPFLLTEPLELTITLFNPMSFWYLDNVSVHQFVGDPVTVRPPYSMGLYHGPDVSSTWPSTTVPEPSTYALMAFGLLAVGLMARRRLSS